MTGNGFKLAMKLIKLGGPVAVQQYAHACLNYNKGLRALMSKMQSQRCLSVIYSEANPQLKNQILRKLVIGNMQLTMKEGSLEEFFANCKKDVVEECKTFLQTIVTELAIYF